MKVFFMYYNSTSSLNRHMHESHRHLFKRSSPCKRINCGSLKSIAGSVPVNLLQLRVIYKEDSSVRMRKCDNDEAHEVLRGLSARFKGERVR